MTWYRIGGTFFVFYAIVAFGAALGTVPRDFFKHPVERLIVRVSCGLMWPMFVGYLLARASTAEVKREVVRGHAFDPIHNGADECECGLVRSAPVHY